MHSMPASSSRGRTASGSAPNPPRSPRHSSRSAPRAEAPAMKARSAYGLEYTPPHAAILVMPGFSTPNVATDPPRHRRDEPSAPSVTGVTDTPASGVFTADP